MPLPTPAVSSSARRSAFDRNFYHCYDAKGLRPGLLTMATTALDHRAVLRVLRGRSRLTNLAVLLLAALGSLSIIYNLSFLFSTSSSSSSSVGSVLATIERDEALARLSHLVVVPGHAIWEGWKAEEALDERAWTLEAYQRGGGRVAAFVDHVQHGVRLAMQDDRALLVFSGGQTRRESTTTEAESYMRLAQRLDLFQIGGGRPGAEAPLFSRATTETYALDSYQNVLFSIARFHQVTGRYPSQMTVVGYEMKRRRFEELHRAAVRFPARLFEYVGLEPVATDEEAVQAREGELQNGYRPYSLDIYGCHDFLLSKRRGRNPFMRFHPYHTSAPELRGLLEWCPDDPRVIYQGPLPWDVLG